MKKAFIIIIIALLVVVVFVQTKSSSKKRGEENKQISSSTPRPQRADYQAGFAIFTRGTFRVFTAPMYHNQSDDVFIQEDNPNIIHVKKSGITWGDFFTTLPFELTKDCLTTGSGERFCSGKEEKLRFFLNGQETPDFLTREIAPDDQAVITFGADEEAKIQMKL